MSFGTAAVNVKIAMESPGYEATREYRAIPLKKAPGNPWKDRVSLGRARNNDLMIRTPSISKLHAHCILGDDGEVSLIDLGSTNGTLRNGRRLDPNQAEKLKDGDRVRFGSVDTIFYQPASLYRVLSEMLRGANTTPPRKGIRQTPPE
jgi:pSer/pThr/pTyr-binding forkhead associated (FHA) protein